MHSPDSHLCSDHCGENPTVWDLPHVPLGLKREWLAAETRRHFLGRGVKALGFAGLATLLGRTAPHLLANTGGAASGPMPPHFAPKAKRAIHICLCGGLSQLESWDPKPGTSTGGPFRAIPTSVPGVHLSELLPYTAKQMHHLALIRSINTKENDHGKGDARVGEPGDIVRDAVTEQQQIGETVLVVEDIAPEL